MGEAGKERRVFSEDHRQRLVPQAYSFSRQRSSLSSLGSKSALIYEPSVVGYGEVPVIG